MSHDTHQALEGIRYYDFFERVIDDIIFVLSTRSAREDKAGGVGRGRGKSSDLEATAQAVHDGERKTASTTLEKQGEGDVDLFGKGMIDNDDARREGG